MNIKNKVDVTKNILEEKELNLNKLSKIFEYSWNIKKLISKKIVTIKINKFGEKLKLLGINGYRIIGAGGGGFFLCVVNKKKLNKLNKYFPKLKILDIEFEPKGTRVLSLLYN